MSIQKIAEAYNLSYHSVKKWSPEKRAAAIRDIQAGVKPHIMQLVGEVAAACYRASCYIGTHVEFDCYHTKTGGNFSVSYRKPGAAELTYLVEPFTAINGVNLAGALVKVEELCK